MPKPEPAQPTEKRTRRPALPLSDRAAEIIRQTAAYTKASIEDVKAAIASRNLGDQEDTDPANTLDELVIGICQGLTIDYDNGRAAERERIFTKPLNPEAVEKPINQRVEGAE